MHGLGERGIKNGRIYTSIGSSAWIAITSSKPVLDFKYYSLYVGNWNNDGKYQKIKDLYKEGQCLYKIF